MLTDEHIDFSLIAPCYNESANVEAFFARANEVFAGQDFSYEVVFVNDGSKDNTAAVLKKLIDTDAGAHNVQVISFSRNFGKESAIYAGMQSARGDAMCLIDADLQQPPELALEMYEYLRTHDDIDVVGAYQDNRNEGKLKGWVKGRFYKTFNATADDIELPENMSDFRVFRRCVAEALLSMPEYHRFSKGLFAWVGFNTHAIPYTPDERHSGKSTWSTRKLFKYAFTGLFSFSTWPLKISKFIGFFTSIAAALYLLYVIFVDYLIFGINIPGYPTLACLILLFGGLQLLVLGIMGDYQARQYIETKRRPLFIVRDHWYSKKS